ncbi:hypothetical protein T265_10179 [Opisthorchis viverrini]|uniref:Uncharacterized protein n=1 Tax=Opisthorchis viverrini TaxID=6198 RepID=A0A074Z3C3_OPIVI|nr:hypothetical protein T265_10179 [Opisthorchis viverrini]KER21513.1 hypothetical protein T265_10179 [Opisthorchis viverrini]
MSPTTDVARLGVTIQEDVLRKTALRGSRSTGIRSTWPSQRNLCSVISSSIEAHDLMGSALRIYMYRDIENIVAAET